MKGESESETKLHADSSIVGKPVPLVDARGGIFPGPLGFRSFPLEWDLNPRGPEHQQLILRYIP